MTPLLVHVETASNKVMSQSPSLWYDEAQQQRIGLAAPISKLLERWQRRIK